MLPPMMTAAQGANPAMMQTAGAAQPAMAAGGGLGNMDPMTLAAILGSVQVPEQQRMSMPQTTFPEVPRAVNPEFSQMVMQAMQSKPQAQVGTLGALLRGIGG